MGVRCWVLVDSCNFSLNKRAGSLNVFHEPALFVYFCNSKSKYECIKRNEYEKELNFNVIDSDNTDDSMLVGGSAERG